MPEPETLRVHIPLELRRRGGRPRILPPKHVEAAMDRGQDPHLLRAIGRAWGWRRRLERGDVATLADLASDENLSDRYVSRLLRLAWLAPEVLERLVVHREPSTISIYDLCFVASLPWDELAGTGLRLNSSFAQMRLKKPCHPCWYSAISCKESAWH